MLRTLVNYASELPNPVKLLPWIFCGSSLSGLALLLWKDEKIHRSKAIGAILLSGIAGTICFLALWRKVGLVDPMLLVAISIGFGIGGASSIDFAMSLIKRKLNSTVMQPQEETNDDGQ